jgi:hypothetical protein
LKAGGSSTADCPKRVAVLWHTEVDGEATRTGAEGRSANKGISLVSAKATITDGAEPNLNDAVTAQEQASNNAEEQEEGGEEEENLAAAAAAAGSETSVKKPS